MKHHNNYIILDNIRSAENVGAIFRTADAVGITKIFLCGITPTPIDRFGRKQQKIAKTALGAEETIAWEQINTTSAIEKLKKEGVVVVAIEQSETSVDYKNYRVEKDTAFVFGAEVDGISKEVLLVCDTVLYIPMYGKKESLNVSVSVGVVLYRLLD